MADYLVEEIKKAIKEINTKDYQTPQIIKHKLDLDTILKDPEEFVMLLKKHLPISKEDNPSSEILSSPLLSIATEIIPPTVNLGAEHSSLQNSFHRCSSCKHGFITEKNPWDITYTWAQEQYVTCPKCGNVDRV
jgi:hypothetical protein